MIPAIKTPIDCTRSPIIWMTAALIFMASPEPPKQPCEWPWPPSCEWPWLWFPGTPWEWPWPDPISINPRTRLKNIAATEIPIMISGLISSSWSMNLNIAEYTRIPVIILVGGLKLRLSAKWLTPRKIDPSKIRCFEKSVLNYAHRMTIDINAPRTSART